MRRLLLISALALTFSCGNATADVVIGWTFGGQSCSAAGVASITVDVASVATTGTPFPCDPSISGIDLGQLLDGNYEVIINGLDKNNNVIYASDSFIEVKGQAPMIFTIDSSAQTGSVSLLWNFGGASCDTAGVKIVSVEIDGVPLTDDSGSSELPCNSAGVDGISVDALFAGNHAFSFFAEGSTQAFSGSKTILVQARSNASVTIPLAAESSEPASAVLSWTFANTLDCSAVSVDTIVVVLDPNSNGSGGTEIGTTTCASSRGNASLLITNIPNGSHSFGVRGLNNGTLTYYTHAPVSSAFTAPNQNDVQVDAEPTP